MELDKNLTTLLKKKKMSLATLARKSGVKQPTLHGWTTGRSVQNLNDLRRVCEILEVSLFKVLFGTHDPFGPDQFPMEELFKGNLRVTIHKVEKLEEE